MPDPDRPVPTDAVRLLLPTTITLRHRTKNRLADYKHGNMSYDDVLNWLLDRMPLIRKAAEHVETHESRRRVLEGITPAEVRAAILRRLNGEGP